MGIHEEWGAGGKWVKVTWPESNEPLDWQRRYEIEKAACEEYREQLAAAEKVCEAVAELHVSSVMTDDGQVICEHCTDLARPSFVLWPCPTLRLPALTDYRRTKEGA